MPVPDNNVIETAWLTSHQREDGQKPRLEVQNVEIPELKPWEVSVALSVSGVCGTDASLAAGHLGPSCAILGHEGVGRIVAIGDGVPHGVAKVGDRVGVNWVRDVCGTCRYCRVPGGESRCVEQWNSGRKWEGTFAEYCVVPSRYLLTIPDKLTLSDELIAPILCGGVTSYKALKTCNAIPGDWIAILGAGGGVGALGIQYAKAMGFRVLALDVGVKKKDFCLRLGAESYLDAASKDIVQEADLVTGGVGSKSVIVTASSGAAYALAFDLVSAFGTVVAVGIPTPDQTMNLHPLQFIDKGISLHGVLAGTHTDVLEALDFVQRGIVNPAVHIISLDELPEAIWDLTKVSGGDPDHNEGLEAHISCQINGKCVVRF